MESFIVRYRNLVVLLAVLLAQIIGLAVQVHRSSSGESTLDPKDGRGVLLLRYWAESAVEPPERFFHGAKMGAIAVWQNYLDLRHVKEQNQQLERTIDRLRLEQAQLLEDAKQGERLQALINFQEKYVYKTLAAQAIGTSGSDHSRVFYLDKGAADGIERDNAVITQDGIVGKVRDVFPHSAQVLAINDQTSGAGVILETTRIRGILRGNAQGRPQIVGILADNRIQPGERVLTAGGDQIFPRGLPVGVVERVDRDPDRDGFIDIVVKPAAHLDRLDEVLVIVSAEPRFSAEEQQDMATSEAGKGAEAAAVKEQMKASAIMAERLPGLTDPNLPPDQQPQPLGATPGPPPRPDQPLHADRFSPGGAMTPEPAANAAAPTAPMAGTNAAAGNGTKPASKPAAKTAGSKSKPASPPAKPPAQPAPRRKQ